MNSYESITIKKKTGCGNIYITVCFGEKEIENIFAIIGKSGGCAYAQCEAISKLLTSLIKKGESIRNITAMLKGISCHQSNGETSSCADAIGKGIEEIFPVD